MNRRLLHLIVSKSLGCLLLAAAGLKIYGFGMTPVGPNRHLFLTQLSGRGDRSVLPLLGLPREL